MPLYVLLPAGTLAGLIVLTFFVYRFIQANNTGAPLDGYPVKLGVPAAIVFASLVLQRLIPMAVLFLIAIVVIVVLIVIYARVSTKPPDGEKQAPAEKPARLVNLDIYSRHIREKALLKRVLRLQSTVNGIRGVAGYNERTLPRQNADILKMENIYLPRIESLLSQYLKVASHDSSYDGRKLMENLDVITEGIRQIHAACLDKDKLSIDAEASALISAMEMDGLRDSDNSIRPRPKR